MRLKCVATIYDAYYKVTTIFKDFLYMCQCVVYTCCLFQIVPLKGCLSKLSLYLYMCTYRLCLQVVSLCTFIGCIHMLFFLSMLSDHVFSIGCVSSCCVYKLCLQVVSSGYVYVLCLLIVSTGCLYRLCLQFVSSGCPFMSCLPI